MANKYIDTREPRTMVPHLLELADRAVAALERMAHSTERNTIELHDISNRLHTAIQEERRGNDLQAEVLALLRMR